ncbi:hypothetical protein AWB75_06729 [Caballeronia catudaia]|uniref:Uncharacterized protein n=1 Tax=Caballeronia catudaia TaxID=1777136 RepID=A0A158DHY3_9BURK|nr:hypothetical protein AWB75_06729 [Caballeronia catudaia]
MGNTSVDEVRALQRECADAYAAARVAYESAKTRAELDTVALNQRDAYSLYQTSAAALDALIES